MKVQKPFYKLIVGSSLLISGLSASDLMAADSQTQESKGKDVSRIVQLSYNSNIILANAGRPETNSGTIDLLERGFTCVDTDYECQRTALMQAILGENPELVVYLLSKSQEVRKDLLEKDFEGNTALHLLVTKAKRYDGKKVFQTMMESLIVSGASWDVKNNDGKTPLDYWHEEMMESESSPEEIRANIRAQFPGAFKLLESKNLKEGGEFDETWTSRYLGKVHPSTFDGDYDDYD